MEGNEAIWAMTSVYRLLQSYRRAKNKSIK
jgi:hypothetical protein